MQCTHLEQAPPPVLWPRCTCPMLPTRASSQPFSLQRCSWPRAVGPPASTSPSWYSCGLPGSCASSPGHWQGATHSTSALLGSRGGTWEQPRWRRSVVTARMLRPAAAGVRRGSSHQLSLAELLAAAAACCCIIRSRSPHLSAVAQRPPAARPAVSAQACPLAGCCVHCCCSHPQAVALAAPVTLYAEAATADSSTMWAL
jgi:hypothetical protein